MLCGNSNNLCFIGRAPNKLSYAADFSNAVFAQLTVDMEYVRENLGLKSTGIWGMLGNIGKYAGNYESGRLGSYQSRPDPKELARSALADITSDKKKAKAFLDTLKAPVGRLNQIPERIDQVR
jgi:hypothetical protein